MGEIVYKEALGGIYIEVEQRGSWYRIYFNGSEMDTVQGKDQAKARLSALRQEWFAKQEHVFPRTFVRPEVGKFLAERIRVVASNVCDISQLPNMDITQQAEARQAIENQLGQPIFSSFLYAQRLEMSRVLDEDKTRYFENIEPVENWTVANNSWYGTRKMIAAYARGVVKSMMREGGVNEAWRH